MLCILQHLCCNNTRMPYLSVFTVNVHSGLYLHKDYICTMFGCVGLLYVQMYRIPIVCDQENLYVCLKYMHQKGEFVSLSALLLSYVTGMTLGDCDRHTVQ